MAKVDLQWHGQDVDLIDHEEIYDDMLERYQEKQEREQARQVLQVSQLDGMIHTADGATYDPATGEKSKLIGKTSKLNLTAGTTKILIEMLTELKLTNSMV